MGGPKPQNPFVPGYIPHNCDLHMIIFHILQILFEKITINKISEIYHVLHTTGKTLNHHLKFD